jgi:BirA family biotin operon repressor/biotin-[acetyl-CoA-carboxylase] ligase
VLAKENYLECELQCKWPNDVLIDSKKVSGVLTESAIFHKDGSTVVDYLCVGIGVNVKSAPSNLNALSFTDISLNTNKMDFFYLFLEILKNNLNEFMMNGFCSGPNGLKMRWMNNAYKINQFVEVGKYDSKVVGIFRDIDENGSIVLEAEDGFIKVNVGDVS